MKATAQDDPAPAGGPDDEDGSLVEEAPQVPLRTVFARFWPQTRGFRGRMTMSLLLTGAVPALSAMSIYLYKVLVDDVLTPHDFRLFMLVAALYLGITIVQGVVTWVDEYLTAWVGEKFVLNLRVNLFTHMQRLSLGFFERRQLGDMMSRLGRRRDHRDAGRDRCEHGSDLCLPGRFLRRDAVLSRLAARVGGPDRRARLPGGGTRAVRAHPVRRAGVAAAIRLDRCGRRGEPEQSRAGPGLRPRVGRGRPLPSREPGRLLRADGRHPPRGAVRAVERPRRAHRGARRDGLRHLRAGQRADHPRRPAGLRRLPEPALRPGRRVRRSVERDGIGEGRCRADHRGARREAGGHRPGRPRAARPRHRHPAPAAGHLHLPRHRATRAVGHRPADLARGEGRRRRGQRGGQDDADQAAAALLRPRRRPRHPRRPRPARPEPLRPAPQRRRRAAGDPRVRRDDRRQHPLGTPGRHGRTTSSAPRGPPTSTASCRTCPTSTRRASASAAGCSPAGNASGSPSRAP